MALKVEQLTREFKFNGMALPDPGPAMLPDEVREFYAITYPELTNAAVEGPEQKGNKTVYEFRRAVGTKGGTKNNPGPFDCYAASDPDEPMFTLLARDKHAPALVWLWAGMRELDGEDPAKVAEARNCAIDMMAYAHEKGRKVAGLGTATLAGCAEFIRTTNGLMKEARERGGLPDPKNEATSFEVIRRYLCETDFEPPQIGEKQ